jgi:hypothetical protein
MDDWDYLLTMRRLKQIMARPQEWKLQIPLHWSGSCADCGKDGILNHDRVCPACLKIRNDGLESWYDEREGK